MKKFGKTSFSAVNSKGEVIETLEFTLHPVVENGERVREQAFSKTVANWTTNQILLGRKVVHNK
jgi:hypothetical protein